MSQDYESALSESWKIYATAFEIIGEEPNEAFKWVFKRAYALGKEKETITQEEIKKAAEKYSQSLGKSRDVTWNDGEYGFIAGVNYTLCKQEKDAEGEVELLHVTRQKVMGLYANAKKLHDLYTSATCINGAESRTIDRTDGTMSVLKTLFGSKCLPDEEQEVTQFKFKVGDKVIYHPFKSDSFYNAEVLEIRDKRDKPYLLHLEDAENLWAYSIEVQTIAETYPDREPKPAEPKYHEGDKVLYNGYVYEVDSIVGKNRYALKGLNFELDEDMIEPYTEPILQPFCQVKETKASVETGDNLFEQHFADTSIAAHSKTDDHIADVSKMMRLNIAAMVLQGFVSNPDWSNFKGKNDAELRQKMAKGALDFADALLTEAESSTEALCSAKEGDDK